MKKRLLRIGTAIIVSVFIFGAFSLSILSYSEGSDPIVTLSYLTEIILPQMKKDILAEVAIQADATVEEQPGNSEPPVNSSETVIETDTSDTQTNEDTADSKEESSSATGTYTLLELESGQCVYTNSALEFIVRPGSEVQVISPFETQGIADITNGVEYLNGDTVAINAYCLIPRGEDGRGIQIINEKSYILVRGEYYIG